MILEKAILEARKKSSKKTRHCIFDRCKSHTITSHVLQKNGILNEISEENHVIELAPTNPFEMVKKGISEFKRIGVNQAYTFQGFCNSHDTDLFKPIEDRRTLNLYLPQHQALFCYRGLCQEIRRKEIMIELLEDVEPHFPQELALIPKSLSDGYEDGLENLSFFKKEFEISIKKNNFQRFHFENVKIPRIELCISVPLTIGELEIPEDNDYEKWRQNKQIPFGTSFINVFPQGQHSFLIIGYHKDFPCNWTQELTNRIRSGTKESIFKELSDLIVLRLEFWTMSQSLFNGIDKEALEEYKKIFHEHAYNHSPQLLTELNLFKGL